jgi:exonuclease SbcD
MKILHTSDWHLGHQLYKYERDEEFRHALRQIINIVREEQPDAFLLSGDVYDTPVPSTSAQNCFTQSLLEIHQACPSMVIIVIAGNHDGKSFLNVSRNLWALAGIHVVGLHSSLNPSDDELQRCTNDVDILEHKFDLGSQIIKIADKGFIVAVPHISDAAYPFLNDTNAPSNIRRKQYFSALLEYVDRLNPQHLPVALMAHLALSSGDFSWHDFGVVGGLVTTPQSDFGTHYDYLALGHIHKSQNIVSDGRLARYSGSIIPISFSEEAPHSVSIVNVGHETTTIDDVTEFQIEPLYSLLTLPASPLPFGQAVESLALIEPDRKCYLRLNVHVDKDNPLPPDALLQVHNCLKDKAARFCEFKIDIAKEAARVENKVFSDPSQLRGMKPVQVAQYVSPTPLPPDFIDMFAEVEQYMQQNDEQPNN